LRIEGEKPNFKLLEFSNSWIGIVQSFAGFIATDFAKFVFGLVVINVNATPAFPTSPLAYLASRN
jgi:hypothetical protein